MDIALWIVAGVLAALFLASGMQKLLQTNDQLVAAGYAFAGQLSTGAIKAIGVLEVLAAVGLVLPAALDVAPVLVPLAAVGLTALMLGAAALHLRRREAQGIVVTLALVAVSAFVAWGRFGPESFTG